MEKKKSYPEEITTDIRQGKLNTSRTLEGRPHNERMDTSTVERRRYLKALPYNQFNH